jgi:hypothetical protein
VVAARTYEPIATGPENDRRRSHGTDLVGPKESRLGECGKALEQAFPRFADDLMHWVEAAKAQRQRRQPRYDRQVDAEHGGSHRCREQQLAQSSR